MAKSKAPTRSASPPPKKPAAKSIQITAQAQIDIAAAAGEGQSALPRFKMVAYTGISMHLASWRDPVVIDLAGLNIPSQMRPIRFSHNPASGVGHTDAIRIEQGQLVASGIVSRGTEAAREIVASSKNGFPWQASVGASVEEFEFIRDGQKVIVNGREFAGPVNVVRKATLGEISFVDAGADENTSVNVAAKAADKENKMPIENTDNVPETQPSTESANDAGKVNASAVDDIRAQAVAETSRIAEVRRLCAGQHGDIEAKAISEAWDPTRTELEILRANRPQAPAIHIHDQNVSTQVLEAACVLTAGLEKPEKHCEEKALDLAGKRFRGGIGLQELLLEAAWANGYSGRNFRDSRSVLKFAFNPGVEAAMSTIDIGGILSNVANKFILDGFSSIEKTWRNITAVRNVNDFKLFTSYRLVGKDQYEIVAPGGELKHGTLGEETYTNKADTYGLQLSVDRRDIINDDLGAITTVSRKLGRGSGLKINDVFWTKYMANSGFFTVGNNNFLSGADTALTIDGLTKAEVAFMDQVDGDGKPIGVMPSIMLVPTSLSAIGSQLFKSLEMRDTTASTKFPVNNPHQGKFRVEVSRYLGNAQYAGNSSKAWYLLADPADLPVIEVAFLNGQESPTIETAEADFGVLGIQMRGYHDFGVNLQDPRGGIKSKGEV